MRILVLSNTPFLPSTAGNRARIGRMLEYLVARGDEVGMLMLPAVDAAEWDVEGMRRHLAWLEVTPVDAAGPLARARARLDRVVRRFARDAAAPIGVDDWCPPWFRAHVRARTRTWKPDVVLAEYVFLSACLEDLPAVHPCVTIVDTHDLMHRRPAVYRAVGLGPQWFHTTEADERRGLLRADVLLAIHEKDAAALRALVPERRVITVPHAHPLRPAPPSAARGGRLLYVASYNDVNVRALAWFTEAIWPLLRAADPALEFIVCGNIATKLGALPPGVVARGFVPSLDAEYAAARVVVSPTRAGTGLPVKTVEALCHGRPVVATPPGAAGLETGDGTGVIVADAADAFAAAVRALLDDEPGWQRACAAATAQAARRFAPDAAFAPLAAVLAPQGR